MLVLQDMDLVPLLIQENYVNHKPAACGNDLQQMKVRLRLLRPAALILLPANETWQCQCRTFNTGIR